MTSQAKRTRVGFKRLYTSLWHWFGLSYSSYLVLPRAVLCDMPKEVQAKLLDVLEYINGHYKTELLPSEYLVKARDDGKFIEDPVGNYRRVDLKKFRKGGI